MDEREERLAKAEALRAADIDPYPARTARDHTAADALANYDALSGQTITVAGRLVLLREMGKATFAHLEDGTGRIQIYIKRDEVGDEAYKRIKLLDLGDFLEATGTLFTTRTGEKTVHVTHFAMLAKALRPLPAKGAGGDLKLFDPEVRHRKRYLDLLANRDERLPIFVTRAKALNAMREFLISRDYLEVETPILQPLYGGATARPFTTHHNALDRDLYLRIAPELYLKRLTIGGMERVYEIGRAFRNEGLDHSHNPEFTIMECYQAYADYEDIMRLVEDMYAHIAKRTLGSTALTYQGRQIDLAPPWGRLTLREAIAEHTGIDYEDYPDRESLAAAMVAHGYTPDRRLGRGRLIDDLKDSIVKGPQSKLLGPVFLYDYPRDLSPLAKAKPSTRDTVERFQAFAGGLELGNAFSELNDPVDQRARFEDQARQRAQGDEEAQRLDEDFIEALETGMPPTGGFGCGVDRLVMLLTDQENIREVILFPTMREQRPE
ncbi:MAG TPA: lysine--tRNA ligase [Ktedonobacterales bacterium]